MPQFAHALRPRSLAALAPALGLGALLGPGAGETHANLVLSTNSTFNGGTLTVNPPGGLFVTHASNNPLLTMSNNAGSSGVEGVAVGLLTGEVAMKQLGGRRAVGGELSAQPHLPAGTPSEQAKERKPRNVDAGNVAPRRHPNDRGPGQRIVEPKRIQQCLDAIGEVGGIRPHFRQPGTPHVRRGGGQFGQRLLDPRPPCPLGEDAPHRLSRGTESIRLSPLTDVAAEAQQRLVEQCGRLERVVRPLEAH